MERPFRHVEVIDEETGAKVKVACLACIRGHRATSCGNQSSCLSKIFWTVKRPGRPSQACMCRLTPGGQCKCNLAAPACTHKVKGEKRVISCRCDEMGRFCCFVTADRWAELVSLKPVKVRFFRSSDELLAAETPPSPAEGPLFVVTPPKSASNMPSVPGSSARAVAQAGPLRPLVPALKPVRPGTMGVGLPWGEDDITPKDPLRWQDDVPMLCHRNSDTSSRVPSLTSNLASPLDTISQTSTLSLQHLHLSYVGPEQDVSDTSMARYTGPAVAQHIDPPSDNAGSNMDKLMADFINYSFPASICQKCSLNGCTCRDCPAVMQNMENGSWGTGCHRVHMSMEAAPVARSSCCTTTNAAPPRETQDIRMQGFEDQLPPALIEPFSLDLPPASASASALAPAQAQTQASPAEQMDCCSFTCCALDPSIDDLLEDFDESDMMIGLGFNEDHNLGMYHVDGIGSMEEG